MREHYHFNGPVLGRRLHTHLSPKMFSQFRLTAAFPFPQNARVSLYAMCPCALDPCMHRHSLWQSAECSNLLEIKLSILTCTQLVRALFAQPHSDTPIWIGANVCVRDKFNGDTHEHKTPFTYNNTMATTTTTATIIIICIRIAWRRVPMLFVNLNCRFTSTIKTT